MIASPFRKIRYAISSLASSRQVTVKLRFPASQKNVHSMMMGARGGALVAVGGGVTLATVQ